MHKWFCVVDAVQPFDPCATVSMQKVFLELHVNQTHLHPTLVISCLRLGSNQANPFDLNIYAHACKIEGSGETVSL